MLAREHGRGFSAARRTGALLALGLAALGLVGVTVLDAVVLSGTEDLSRSFTLWGASFVGIGAALLYVATVRLWLRGESADPMDARSLLQIQRRSLSGVLVSSSIHDANNVLLALRFKLAELGRLHTGDASTSKLLGELEQGCDELETVLSRQRDMGGRARGSELKTLDVGEVIRSIVDFLHHHETVRHCDLRIDVDDGTMLVAQPELLMQIVVNLVINAAEATDGSGRIDVRVENQITDVVFEVHDDGPGIAPERRETMLRAFRSTRPGAAGLGLWAARLCAREHGGELLLGTSPLGGLCVRVTIPRGLDPANERPGSQPRPTEHVVPVRST